MAYRDYQDGEITIRDCKIKWYVIRDLMTCEQFVRFDCHTRDKILSTKVKLTALEEERYFTSSCLFRRTIAELLEKAGSLYAKEQIIARRKADLERDFV